MRVDGLLGESWLTIQHTMARHVLYKSWYIEKYSLWRNMWQARSWVREHIVTAISIADRKFLWDLLSGEVENIRTAN